MDESIPYRTNIPGMSPEPSRVVTKDGENYNTLLDVRRMLAEGLTELDKWHAFDLKENELTIKQQIKAHELAYDLVAPLLERVDQALRTVDNGLLERQRG